MAEIFISYAAKDSDRATLICSCLEKEGFTCWIAPRDIIPGEDWMEAILEGIERCRVLVLLWSSQANASSHIKREVERALNKGLFIIPVRIENILPSRSLEYLLGSVQWLDAFNPPFDRHLGDLACTIHSLVPTLADGSRAGRNDAKPETTATIHRLSKTPHNKTVDTKITLGVVATVLLLVAVTFFLWKFSLPPPVNRTETDKGLPVRASNLTSVPKETVSQLESEAIRIAQELLEAASTPEGIKKIEDVVRTQLPTGGVPASTPVIPATLPVTTQNLHLPNTPPKSSSHPYELQVLKITTASEYVTQFGVGGTVRANHPSDVLVVIQLRLFNHSEKALRAVLMKEHPGNTALLDSEGRSYPPVAYDARVVESKDRYLVASIVAKAATDFAVIFTVPKGITPKSLRLSVIEGQPVQGNSTDLVVDIRR